MSSRGVKHINVCIHHTHISSFCTVVMSSPASQECWQTRHVTSREPRSILKAPVKLNLADTIKSVAFWNWKRWVASQRWWIPRGSSQMKTRPRHLNIALICITGLMSHLETPEKDRAAGGRGGGGGRRASLSGVQSERWQRREGSPGAVFRGLVPNLWWNVYYQRLCGRKWSRTDMMERRLASALLPPASL